VNALGGGWNLSGIFRYTSGSPLVATGSGCGGAPLGTCMPSLVPGVSPRVGVYGSNVVANPSAANYYAKTSYLNPAAFSVLQPGGAATIGTTVTSSTGTVNFVGNGTALYAPGNAARVGAYNVWSQSYYNLDLGLKRTFPIWEKVTLQFEADLFNATNHVVFSSLNGGVAGSSFGFTSLPTAYLPRDAQMSARVSF